MSPGACASGCRPVSDVRPFRFTVRQHSERAGKLDLVYDDPRGWLQNYIKKRPVPNRAAKGTGFIYVLAITGAVSYVKVGSTAGPRARFAALRSEAHRFGSTVTRAWLSPAHPEYQTSESRALASCRALSPSSTPRSEYFPELDFVSARREAVKAVLGIRDQPRVSTATRAAGLHEPFPVAVRADWSRAPTTSTGGGRSTSPKAVGDIASSGVTPVPRDARRRTHFARLSRNLFDPALR